MRHDRLAIQPTVYIYTYVTFSTEVSPCLMKFPGIELLYFFSPDFTGNSIGIDLYKNPGLFIFQEKKII